MIPYKIRFLVVGAGFLVGSYFSSIALAGPLNDTGIDFCREHADGTDTPINATTTCQPLSTHGGQDARYGRDAAAVKGALPQKVGGSAGTVNGNPNGFDFTKISNSGTALDATATLGSGPNDWACTYDNNTGLMWEVKTTSGLRSQDHTYTWYDDVHPYGGNAGVIGSDTCGGTLAAAPYNNRCNTQHYVATVNAVGLCGKTDWRMPTLRELYNIADRGRTNPAIDPTYFPNTPASHFWSASPYAGISAYAWDVYFDGGYDNWNHRSVADHVRLVRAGQ